jgi:hypothetical protein
LLDKSPNGWHCRAGELVKKPVVESVVVGQNSPQVECPHLSGARFGGRFLEGQDLSAEKRHYFQLNKIFTDDPIFDNRQKTRLAKMLI